MPDLESYLTMGSLQIFKRLQLDLGYDIEFRQSGGLQIIQTPRQYEYARDRVISLKSRGYTAEILSTDEARAIEPGLNPDCLGAMYFPLRGQADPVKTTRAFADAARQRGAEILTGARRLRASHTEPPTPTMLAPQMERSTPTISCWRPAPGARRWAKCWASASR